MLLRIRPDLGGRKRFLFIVRQDIVHFSFLSHRNLSSLFIFTPKQQQVLVSYCSSLLEHCLHCMLPISFSQITLLCISFSQQYVCPLLLWANFVDGYVSNCLQVASAVYRLGRYPVLCRLLFSKLPKALKHWKTGELLISVTLPCITFSQKLDST